MYILNKYINNNEQSKFATHKQTFNKFKSSVKNLSLRLFLLALPLSYILDTRYKLLLCPYLVVHTKLIQKFKKLSGSTALGCGK